MALILGIDPGSRCTGYGIIAEEKKHTTWVAHGQIQTQHKPHQNRLYQIFEGLNEIILQYQPQQVVIEQVFVHKNVQSALKLGQARGAALVAAAHHHLPVAEYTPRQIKQAIVGYGAATKSQMQTMIRALLKLTQNPPSDAADALAIALCHCHFAQVSGRLKVTTQGQIIDY